MKVKVSEIRQQLKALLATSGAPEHDVEIITDHLLQQDLRQNFFSGVGEAEEKIALLRDSIGKEPEYEVDKSSLKLINAHGRSVMLVGADVADMVATMAKQSGIAMVGVHGGGYDGMMEYYARAIARHDVVAIVGSNGGPHTTVPFGGSKSISGTNPLAYAIPTDDLPIAFDGATSRYPFGAMAHAKARGEQLPADSFLDADGSWTTDPDKAESIIPFGGHKGYAINLLLEIMTGVLLRARSGLLNRGAEDIGTFYIAIDPAAFGDIDEFKSQTTQLARDIEAVSPAKGYDRVAVPGYRGERSLREAIEQDEIEIDDQSLESFRAAYAKLVG